MVQFGAIDLIWKGLAPGSHLPLGGLYRVFTFFQEIVALLDFSSGTYGHFTAAI